jgi:hypothetical protein
VVRWGSSFRRTAACLPEPPTDRSIRLLDILSFSWWPGVATLACSPAKVFCARQRYYYDASGGQSGLQLKVNGSNAGAGWTANAESNTWRSRTLVGLIIRNGDDLEVEVRTSGTELGELDYVGLTFRGVQ